jgi:hypothetical protein
VKKSRSSKKRSSLGRNKQRANHRPRKQRAGIPPAVLKYPDPAPGNPVTAEVGMALGPPPPANPPVKAPTVTAAPGSDNQSLWKLVAEIEAGIPSAGLGTNEGAVRTALKNLAAPGEDPWESVPFLADLMEKHGNEQATAHATQLRHLAESRSTPVAPSPAPAPGDTAADVPVPQEPAPASDAEEASGDPSSVAGEYAQEAIEVPADRYKLEGPFTELFGRDEKSYGLILSDMKSHGYDRAHPAIAWLEKGVIIDGVQRTEIAQAVGLKTIWVVLRSFKDEAEALRFALRCQRARRNLDDATLMKVFRRVDRPGKRGGDHRSPEAKISASKDGVGSSAAATASVLGISETKVEHLRAVVQDPTLQAQVESGQTTVHAAHEKLRKKQRGTPSATSAYNSALGHAEKALEIIRPHDKKLAARLQSIVADLRNRMSKLESTSSPKGGKRGKTGKKRRASA